MKPVARSLSVVVTLLFLASCGSSAGAAKSGRGLISLDEEWQLGEQMAAQVAKQAHIVNDPQALVYLRKIGEQLHMQTPTSIANRPFEFEIIDDPSVNAFSIPGGHIYVTSGLIGTAAKADELAAVMAHEISHIVARHVAKQASQQQDVSALVAQALSGGAMGRFSRADEKEADEKGFDLMVRAGFDPHGMLDVYQRLLALQQGGNGAVSRFFADHPGAQDRMDDVKGKIAKLTKTSGIVDEPDFQAVHTRYPNAGH